MTVRRFVRDLRYAIRRQWWVAIRERQRVIEERDRFKAWADVQFNRAREAEHAVYMLKAEHLPASIDTLRKVADDIDCGGDCEHVSPMDWSTGVRECHLSDRGECPFDDAYALRELASALETHAKFNAAPVSHDVKQAFAAEKGE